MKDSLDGLWVLHELWSYHPKEHWHYQLGQKIALCQIYSPFLYGISGVSVAHSKDQNSYHRDYICTVSHLNDLFDVSSDLLDEQSFFRNIGIEKWPHLCETSNVGPSLAW